MKLFKKIFKTKSKDLLRNDNTKPEDLQNDKTNPEDLRNDKTKPKDLWKDFDKSKYEVRQLILPLINMILLNF